MIASRQRAWPAAMLVALLLWSAAAAAEVRARFDRTEVHTGDTVTLTIESDGLGGGQPDLGALDADFEVLGTSSGSRIEFVNGRQSAMRTWQVTLVPKRAGSIEVPPFTVGKERTQPLRLDVTTLPQGPTGTPGDDVFLELEVGGGDGPVYVQQQVPLTVRLFSALPLRGGDLTTPRPDGAVLERLGEDVQFSTRRNSRRYQVIERRFSLSPERSGALRIEPATFSGELRGGDDRAFGDDRLAQLFRDPVFERFGSGLFERGEPVRARSGAVTLDVQPQPEGFSGRWWLPARALDIADSWERDPPELARGEPATRTLTVTATGLAGSQIPEIEVPTPAAVRVYADPVEAETRTDGEQLFGVSRQQVTVMPTAGGSLTFPEIRVRWWDVDAGRERVAVVPARRFEVPGPAGADAPAAGTAGAPQPSRAPPVDAAAPEATGSAAAPAADAGAPASGPSVPNRLAETRRPVGWLLLAALVVGGALLLWRQRHRLPRLWRRRPHAAGSHSMPSVSIRRPGGGRAAADLRPACAANDPQGAATAVLALARRYWGPAAPTSLGGVAARLAADGSATGAQAATAVLGLEASLYGPGGGNWQGDGFAEQVLPALTARSKAPGSGRGDEPLAPLYPQRG